MSLDPEELNEEIRVLIKARDHWKKRAEKFHSERDKAYSYAKNFCEDYVKKYCSPSEYWKVLPDLIGVLTQIDNATTVIKIYVERAAQIADKWATDEQKKHGNGGPGAEIRKLLEPKE